jgi:hypothetical protein
VRASKWTKIPLKHDCMYCAPHILSANYIWALNNCLFNCKNLARYSIRFSQNFIYSVKLYPLSNGYLRVSGARLKMNENPTQTRLYFAPYIILSANYIWALNNCLFNCKNLPRYSIGFSKSFVYSIKLYALSNGYLHVSGASMKMNENPTQTWPH